MAQTPYSLPGSDLDLADPDAVAQVFREAARLNREDPRRRGSTIELPGVGRLLATGDLHDNSPHLQRVVKRAKLEQSPDHYLVLHELIHGPSRLNGMDLSVRTLARACAVKLAFPEQVFFLLSNHELAQRRQEHVFKEGGSDIDAFNDGLAHLYGDDGAAIVHAAFDTFVDALPLAVRCANGVMVAHSLPGPRKLKAFDPAVIERALVPGDADGDQEGSAYLMVWGRRHTPELGDALAKAWGVKQFVLGHQHADMGWQEMADNILIINSDHGHGVCLPIDLATTYDRDDLIQRVLPINAIRL